MRLVGEREARRSSNDFCPARNMDRRGPFRQFPSDGYLSGRNRKLTSDSQTSEACRTADLRRIMKTTTPNARTPITHVLVSGTAVTAGLTVVPLTLITGIPGSGPTSPGSVRHGLTRVVWLSDSKPLDPLLPKIIRSYVVPGSP